MRRPAFLLLLFALAVPFGSAVAVEATSSSTAESRRSTFFADQVDVQAWQLDDEEAARYARLMRGIRGSFSKPNISPLEVLGIHARSAAERRRYAERLVRLLYEDTERVMAFEREVQAAWKRLYGDVPIIDTAKLPPDQRPWSLDDLAGKRLAAFVSTACAACERGMPRLLTIAQDERIEGMDFYVVDTDKDEDIRAWARRHRIPPEQVKAKRITLNRGKALFARLGGRTVPAIFARDGDDFEPVPALSATMEARK